MVYLRIIVVVIFFIFYLSNFPAVAAVSAPVAVAVGGRALIAIEERCGLVSHTNFHVTKIIKEKYGSPEFNAAFEEGVNYVSENPAYHLTTLTTKATGDTIIGGQLLISLLNFLSSVSMTPENSKKGLVWFPAMKRMFESCQSTDNPGDCVESVFEDGKKLYERTDFISTQLYREYITYAMQVMGLWKFLVDNYPAEVFAAVNMNMSASQSVSPNQRILFSLNLSITITMGKY